MTSYEDLIESVEDSEPIEVYTIVLGSDTFNYTSSADELTIDSVTYTPIPISRNQVIVGSDRARRVLSVNMPASNEVASQYIDSVPADQATLSLFSYQRNESPAFDTTVLLFTGVVQSVKFPNNGQMAELEVRSLEAALSQNVPRFTYGGQCANFLYDSNCGADPGLFNHVGEVTDVTGNTITVDGLDASGFDFVSGYATPVSGGNDFRLIIAQSGDVLTMLLPFVDDHTGENLQVFAGCDHNIAGDCALVFDRVIDYIGFPFVPNKDILQTGVT